MGPHGFAYLGARGDDPPAIMSLIMGALFERFRLDGQSTSILTSLTDMAVGRTGYDDERTTQLRGRVAGLRGRPAGRFRGTSTRLRHEAIKSSSCAFP